MEEKGRDGIGEREKGEGKGRKGKGRKGIKGSERD